MSGTLYIVSTPIGNIEDITIRAIQTLFTVDSIVCEDTRRTGNLLQLIQPFYKKLNEKEVKRPVLIAMNNFNEESITVRIVELLKEDKSIALVSDGGTPLISDPGYPLVKKCIENDIQIVPIPGSSALLTALVASGLPVYPFTFLGYPPEKPGKRMALFHSVKSSIESKESLASTAIIYASPHKVIRILEELETVFGDSPIVIARELTKIHEEIARTTIVAAINNFKVKPPKGELVLLLSSKI